MSIEKDLTDKGPCYNIEKIGPGAGGESSKMPERGLIQVYTGKGKGKTSAALGQALQAAGQGLKVCIIQFLKGPVGTGERAALKGNPLIEMESFGGEGFVDPRRPADEDRRLGRQGLARAFSMVEEGSTDLLILDEINVGIAHGLSSVEEVLDLLRKNLHPWRSSAPVEKPTPSSWNTQIR